MSDIEISKSSEYSSWLKELKEKFQQAQILMIRMITLHPALFTSRLTAFVVVAHLAIPRFKLP